MTIEKTAGEEMESLKNAQEEPEVETKNSNRQ